MYDLYKMEKEIQNYSGKKPELAPLLQLYKAIYTTQQNYVPKLSLVIPTNISIVNDKLRSGEYLLREVTPDFTPVSFREVTQAISVSICRNSPNPPPNLNILAKDEALSGMNGKKLAVELAQNNLSDTAAVVVNSGIEGRTGIDNEILQLVLIAALATFYMAHSQAVTENNDFKLWQQGYCPVCGQYPKIAKFREEDNSRILHCGFCHTEWSYPRLKCPFCENSEQNKLEYFYVPDDEARRVQVCGNCKNYLKTIDQKKLAKNVNLIVEDLYTRQLDLLALREGFKPTATPLNLH